MPPARACKARMSANCGNTRRQSVKGAGAGARGEHSSPTICAAYLWRRIWLPLTGFVNLSRLNRSLR